MAQAIDDPLVAQTMFWSSCWMTLGGPVHFPSFLLKSWSTPPAGSFLWMDEIVDSTPVGGPGCCPPCKRLSLLFVGSTAHTSTMVYTPGWPTCGVGDLDEYAQTVSCDLRGSWDPLALDHVGVRSEFRQARFSESAKDFEQETLALFGQLDDGLGLF